MSIDICGVGKASSPLKRRVCGPESVYGYICDRTLDQLNRRPFPESLFYINFALYQRRTPIILFFECYKVSTPPRQVWGGTWKCMSSVFRAQVSNDLRSLITLRFGGWSGRVSFALVLANEWVGVFPLIQVAQGMIHPTVARLVSSDVEDEVFHGPLALGHLPVLDSKVGNHEIRIRPLRQVAFVDLLDAHCVRVDSFFFEVADKPMRDLGGDEVS